MDSYFKVFDRMRKNFLADEEFFFSKMKKNSLQKIYESIFLTKKSRNCSLCLQKNAHSQRFLHIKKKIHDSSFLIFILQYNDASINENYLLDLFLITPQTFEASKMGIKVSVGKENFAMVGLITENSQYIKNYLECEDDFFKESKGIRYNWIDMWREIIQKKEKILVLLYVQ